MQKIVVVDYGIGNVFSVCNALKESGFAVELTRDENAIKKADKLILPGVGAFAKARAALDHFELPEILNDFVQTGKPFLGICVGMQLLFDSSTEFGGAQGLGYIHGPVERIPDVDADGTPLRVPHISWAELRVPKSRDNWQGTIFQEFDDANVPVYFVHSFHGKCADESHLLSEAEYGGNRITAAVQRDNILGFQFHPERSGRIGQDIFKRFHEL